MHEVVTGRRPQVVVLSRQGEGSLDPVDAALLAECADVAYHPRRHPPDHDEAVRLLRGAHVLAATNRCLPRVDVELLDALPGLRAVVLYATGYDHLDVALLARRGVGLSVLPEYATTAVAEHAVGMLFALAQRVHLANDRSRGLVHPDTSLRGVELAGRTLGVLGVGRIGSRVAELGRALGMRVLGSDVDPRAVAAAQAAGVVMTGLDALLDRSDAVLVCASHRFGAPPLLGAAELHRLRPGTMLVNVSRAALVETAAVVASVRAGCLRGYAVDDVVLDPDVDGDLLREGRVLQTGHSAWWRDEVLERGRRMWGQHVLAAVHDEPLDAVTWPGGAGLVPVQHLGVRATR